MFNIIGETPWVEMEEKVRQTTLLHPRDGEIIYPYADADIQLREVNYDEVLPTAEYATRPNLALQTRMAQILMMKGHHPLELDKGLILSSNSFERVGLVPPIVEQTDVDGTYILDGLHRTIQGRWAGRKSFMAIFVTGIRPDCPSYARPNKWEKVIIYEEAPADPALKKDYRPDYEDLYRDFGPLNGSKIRKRQSHAKK